MKEEAKMSGLSDGYVDRLEWLAKCAADLKRESQDGNLPRHRRESLEGAAYIAEQVTRLCRSGSRMTRDKADAILERFKALGELERPFREISIIQMATYMNSL